MRRRILLFSVLLAIAAIIVTSVIITVVSYHYFSASVKRNCGIIPIVALIVFLMSAVSVLIASFVTRKIVRPVNTIDTEHQESSMEASERQERDKLRREFTANVSHELKTPLTVISGYAELIANSVAKPQDVPEFSRKIYREAKRMIALVNDLMFLSGLEENASPSRESVNLLELSDEVVHRLASKAAERKIELSATGDPVEIQGITSVLEEMIYNLLDNAIKYNREGGSVAITVQQGSGTATLTIADTGSGIPKSEHERIFERFYRVDKSRNKAIPGTGLGLSIVKHGAMLHDGEIELESDEGAGTRVIMRFPVK